MKNLLTDTGLRVTKGRKEVLSILDGSSVPLSADEVIAKVDRHIVSGSSVYRILSELEQAKILSKTIRQNGISYYELHSSHRHYIVCSKCGKLLALENCPIHPFAEIVEKTTGFKITGHMVELIGICPECQKNQKSESL